MRGTVQNKVDRETCFNNEFDQFVAEHGEALVSVYNRFAQLMNDLERNGVIFLKVTINTKFLNCLQPEWLKTTTPYYVTHPSLVVDYDDDYQGDAVETEIGSSALLDKDEAGVILTEEHNDFLFADASRVEEIEELSANICFMARIQPEKFDSDEGPSYDSAFLSKTIVELQKTQLILKRRMSENEDKYHDTVIDLEAIAKKNEDVVLKIGNSLQGMFMLRLKPMSFYDSKVKRGLSSKNHPPMLNKDNYVPWSSRIIRYTRSRPNGKMIVDSIENGPYVRRMIANPGESDLPVPESFHEQTNKELTENDINRMDADDQAIQTILLGLPEDVLTLGNMRRRQSSSMNGKSSQSIAANLKFLNNLQPEWKRHVTIVRQTKNLHEADFTQINDFLKMNQDENGGIQVTQNAVQNTGIQSGGDQNGLVLVPEITNHNRTGNVVAVRAKGTGNGNQARCYNCRGLGHITRNCTARPKRRDAAYLQTQLLIAQKEEAGIQLQAEEFDFMAAAGDLDEIEEAPVYDKDGSAEVQLNNNCYDNEIFNMFTQEEQYTDLLEPIPEPQLVPQNDNHVNYVSPIDQVAQVNMVNCNMRATNAELKSELPSYKIQEQRIEISQEKYDKLEKCYQKSIYKEQCLTREINALHLSSTKQITTLNDEISNLNKQLSKEKSSISSLMEEKKKLKHDFKTREDKFLDKEVDLEGKIKDLENILLKRDQTIQRISLTEFPAQSVGSSNTDVSDSPCLLVLITGTSQSRQRDPSGSGRIIGLIPNLNHLMTSLTS
nr:hypothetical protein [Tanacetum cinerariifolium]